LIGNCTKKITLYFESHIFNFKYNKLFIKLLNMKTISEKVLNLLN